MAAQIHVGDIGTRFTATVKDQDGVAVDVSAATLTMTFTKPSKALVTKTPSLVSGGTDGIIRYTTLSGDLDEAGQWHVQALAVIAATQWHTDIHDFTVVANL